MNNKNINNEKEVTGKQRCLLIFVLASLSACSVYEVKDGAPSNYNKKWDEISDAVPVDVTPSKYGNPDNYEVFGKRYYTLESAQGFSEEGVASWYGKKFHGERTSSGEIYDMYAMTAAHKTLPIPVFVEVSNLDNGRKAIVKVNDRGPFHEGRVIDLSYAAATKLGVASTGTANVAIRVVDKNGDSLQSEIVLDSAVAPSVISDKLFIQVAAFADESNAIDFLRRLHDEGFRDVRMYIENKAKNPVYRVKIGPLPSQSVAQDVLVQLEQKSHQNLKIIKVN
jgi:rare lipoprotein A